MARSFTRSFFSLILFASFARAEVVTFHQDAGGPGALVDGTFASNEYGPANSYSFTGGGAGFGGMVGAATLHLKSDNTHLYIGFSNLGVPPVNPDQCVVYLHTRPGGFQPDGGMNDTADAVRRNVSFLSTGGTERIIFRDGAASNSPDFALVILNRTNGFSRLFELRGSGDSHHELPHLSAGRGTPTPEFAIARSALGLGDTGVVEFVALAISDTGFLSNEGLPNPNLASNPGFNNGGTTIYSNFHRFAIAPPASLTQRVANTTLAMPQAAPSATTNSYGVPNAFGTLTFSGPMLTLFPPGETNRLFIVERSGTVQVLTNIASTNKTLFFNISSRVNTSGEGGLLGMAFHSGYATNRRFFVFYTTTATNGTGTGFHTRVSEFQTSATNANFASPTNELILFSQFNDAANHNAGDIAFGPDGYLYITTGDEGNSNDSLNNSQRIDKDFFSSILRIDVDKRPGSLAPNRHPAINAPTTNYAIPPDNPFIGATQFNGSAVVSTNVRTEFWAVGLRNPFRFSFDEVTGDLYAADVGQNAREEVNLIKRGGNYGWKWREGKIATPGIGTPPAGFTNWIDPLLDYTRGVATNQGTSITGGRVYRGDRYPELVGKYIFADYNSGNIWSLTHDGTNATSFAYLANDAGIVHIGRDPRNGDLLLCDLTAGVVRRLIATNAPSGVAPPTLADAGAFADLVTLTPNPGIVPYDLNLPFWSDGARKTRWFSLPSTNLTITFSPDQSWGFPTSMVWIKHFEIETTSGVPASARRLETRFLVKNADGSGGYGVTYRWGLSATNAALVPDGGLDEPILIDDGGTIRTQIWRYPSRAECLQCHRVGAGFALGFNTPQLNRDFTYGPGDTTNQLRRLSDLGYFHTNVASINFLRALAHPTNEAASIEYRARSYLQANCANCHFPGGPVPAGFDARLFTPLSSAALVNGALANDFGNTNNRVIRPALITNSMLHTRIAIRGPGQMPPLASSLSDTQGVALIAAWIGSLAGYQSFAEWQLAQFGSTSDPGVGPDEDFDGDGAGNWFEYLTGTLPTIDASFWAGPAFVEADGAPRIGFERLANRGFLIQVNTDLLHGAWTPLDIPENRPIFAASPEWVEFTDPASTNEGARNYRVDVFEP